MRYKPRSEKKPELLPVKLDASDLDHILLLAGEGAILEIETTKCVYDDVSDVAENLHRRSKLEKLVVKFKDAALDEIKIVPSFWAFGKRAKAAAPSIEAFLRDHRQRPVRVYGTIVGLVVGWFFTAGPNILFHSAKGDLESQYFFSWMTPVLSLCLGWLGSAGPPGFKNLIVPQRRDGSWLREHVATLVVAVVAAVVGAIATKLLT